MKPTFLEDKIPTLNDFVPWKKAVIEGNLQK